MFLVERIAHHLATHGICSTKDLAIALDEPAARVGDAIKAERNRARWGISKMQREDDHHSKGGSPNMWQINVRVFQRYLAERRDMPWIEKRIHTKAAKAAPKAKAPKAPCVKVPKEIYRPASNAPEYTGPSLTRWQPSSPYYKDQQ